MEASPSRKERTHQRIVDAAARAIRRHGYSGVGVADVMQQAGLTHGGFYAHFASREALLVEAIEQAGRASATLIEGRTEALRENGASPFRALVESYLSDSLLKSPEHGCPVAALCSEMPRQAPDVRKASSLRARGLVSYVQKALPASVPAERAALITATLIGTVQLARIVGTAEQGRALLASARTALLAEYDR